MDTLALSTRIRTKETTKTYSSMGRVRQIPPQPRQRRDPRRVDEHRSHNLQPPDTKPRPEPPLQVRAHVRSKVALDDRVPVNITRRLVGEDGVRQAAPIQPTEPIHKPRSRNLEDEENNEGGAQPQGTRTLLMQRTWR